MKTLTMIASPAVAGIALLCAGAIHAEVRDVKVTTDRSIDCSSMTTIARDLYRNCKTDEAKAIATWQFVRRTQFHWPKKATWNSLELINSYGYSLCGQQSRMFAEICAAGDLQARTVHCKGHNIAEAFYDDSWHVFDCHIGWYALRKDKSGIASCDEMKADPTIITDAVKDGRASAPFMHCGDPLAVAVGAIRTSRPGQPVPVSDQRMVVNLRRGESITRRWGNEGKALRIPDETKWLHPRHACSTGIKSDRTDPVNSPFWIPYESTQLVKSGPDVVLEPGVLRYYGNGRMVYEPNLADAAFVEDLGEDRFQRLTVREPGGEGPKVRPALPGVNGQLSIRMECAYKVVDAWLDAEIIRQTDADIVTINALPRQNWREPIWTPKDTGRLSVERLSLYEATTKRGAYTVQISLRANADVVNVGIESLRITTVFMNNFQALPHLAPGQNTLRVSADQQADLKANKLKLTYVWNESGKEKTLSKTVPSVPFETKVAVAGSEMPRMKSVTLAVEP